MGTERVRLLAGLHTNHPHADYVCGCSLTWGLWVCLVLLCNVCLVWSCLCCSQGYLRFGGFPEVCSYIVICVAQVSHAVCVCACLVVICGTGLTHTHHVVCYVFGAGLARFVDCT